MYGGENFCDFQVLIGSQKKDGSGLIFDCTSTDTEVAINNVQFAEDMNKMSKVSRFERGYYHYAGPDFTSLDERLQTGLSEYL